MLDPKLDTLLLVAEKRNFTRGSSGTLADPAGGEPSHQPAGTRSWGCGCLYGETAI